MVDGSFGILLAVALGSAAGGVLRHLLTETAIRLVGGGFPWGTLLVNVAGSAAMGAVAAIAGGLSGSAPWSPIARHAAMTGVLGGFTTFSAFSMQTVALAGHGEWLAAGLNVGLSIAACLGACWAGYAGLAWVAR
ncbi:MAG: CrcB family protein [Vicinamibacterales bacterium]